jgi:DNA-binding MarR family transcriptional regulator
MSATHTQRAAADEPADEAQRDHVDTFLEELELPGIDLTIEGIVDRIMGISRRLKRTMDETLSGFELTWGEWTVLGSLVKAGAPHRLSPGDLSRKHELSSGAMTNRLDRLEEAGLIRRIPNVDDRRGVLIEITDDGHRLWRESVGAQAKNEAMITTAALDRREREELNTFLRRLMISFEETDPPGWSRPC